MHDHERELVESAFGGKVINRYGSREFGNIAQEDTQGNMNINELNFLIESHKGKLLVTCFDNLAMPFIRYDIGDLGNVEIVNEKATITNLAGRTAQVIKTPTGKTIHPTYFYYLVDYTYGKYIKQFQVVQESETHVTLKLVVLPTYTKKILAQMQQRFNDVLEGMDVTIKQVQDIPKTKEGKRVVIVKNI